MRFNRFRLALAVILILVSLVLLLASVWPAARQQRVIPLPAFSPQAPTGQIDRLEMSA